MDLLLGAVLVAVGLVLLGAELHLSTAGVLAATGIASLYLGSVLLVVGSGHGMVVALIISAAIAMVLSAATAVVGREVRRGRRVTPRAGPDALVGRVGVVATPPDPLGQVNLEGARWRARRARNDTGGPLHAGDAVVVAKVSDLTVWVRRSEVEAAG